MSTTTDHAKVCTVITAITGQGAFVQPNYGHWNGNSFVGFACNVDMPNGSRLVVPAKTEIEAACEALATVRERFPERAAKASWMRKCAEGMAIYAAYAEAKADAAMAESAARLADMRAPVRGADLSPAVEAV